MVSRPTSIPFSGDVLLLLRETPILKCSIPTEANNIIILFLLQNYRFSLVNTPCSIRIRKPEDK